MGTTDTTSAGAVVPAATDQAPPAPAAPASPPAAAPAPQAPQAAAPAAPAPGRVQVADLPTEALTERLTRERKAGANEAITSLLKELGVESSDVLKQAIEDRRKAEEQAKTDSQKLTELQARQTQELAKLKQYETALNASLMGEVESLTPEQREAYEMLKSDDPANNLKVVMALQKAKAKEPAQPETPAVPAAPATPAPAVQARPPAADTAPPRGSAPDSANESPPDHKAVWEGLQATNPFKAASYLREHQRQIFPSGS
jgi:hypothetical protein